jgi:hypothetical protein
MCHFFIEYNFYEVVDKNRLNNLKSLHAGQPVLLVEAKREVSRNHRFGKINAVHRTSKID